MKQHVVTVASEQGRADLAPALETAGGVVHEHFTEPGLVERRLAEATPDLLILVHPLPDLDTVAFWESLEAAIGRKRLPLTVVAAAPDAMFDLEPLEAAGVRLINLKTLGTAESALADFLRKAPRPDTRVMVKVAVELGAGKVLRIAQTVNVSRSGLLIRTKEQFPPGAILDLKLELPGEKAPIEARAEVVRRADPDLEKVHGLGARFVWFRASDEKRFDAFMRRAELDPKRPSA